MEKLRKWFDEYTLLPVAKKGERIDKEVILKDGKFRKIKGVAANDLNVPLLRARKKEVKRIINLPPSIKGEVQVGQKLGELVIQLDKETIGKVDIISPTYIPKANLFTRIVRRTGLNF